MHEQTPQTAVAASLHGKVSEFLATKRIAVVGVSRATGAHPAANLIHHRLRKAGHEVFAVNPNMETFENQRCWPDLKAIPGGVDGAVILTRPETTEQVVRDCEAAGVRRVWMHASFVGSSVSPEAVAYCQQHGIQVIAGACPMMFGEGVDFGHACMRWLMGLTKALPS